MQSFHKKVQKRKNNNIENTLVERQHWNVSASPHQKISYLIHHAELKPHDPTEFECEFFDAGYF